MVCQTCLPWYGQLSPMRINLVPLTVSYSTASEAISRNLSNISQKFRLGNIRLADLLAFVRHTSHGCLSDLFTMVWTTESDAKYTCSFDCQLSNGLRSNFA